MNPLVWIEKAVSWVLITFHSLLSTTFAPDSGWAWGLAIVGLVILIRLLLVPLFVKQIKSQRNMQLIQPQVKEIQKKYAGDRERQSQELMKLYKDTGTNPLSSCLPLLAQAPIFYSLFRVLQGIAQSKPYGLMTDDLVKQAQAAKILGAPISGTFTHRSETTSPTSTLWVTLVMIVLMVATTFLTQRQMIVKNSASDNPMVQQQKILLYVFPFIFLISGVNFPIGVLLYWCISNLWTMGQQFYVIRNSPQPGTPAYAAMEARQKAKLEKLGGTQSQETEPEAEERLVRNQPKKKPKKKR
ncbi:MAG: membrane protein insertase YidC [Actinomycetes bacterium]